MIPRAACLLLALAAATSAPAAERLDDSASPRSRVTPRVVLTDEGRPLVASRNPTRAIVQVRQVDYRLSTARYAGRQARIYYVIPAFIPGLRSPAGLRVEWRGSLFASGTARPGERTLVWSGVVPGPWINERMDLNFQLELREVQPSADARFEFEPFFEIEVSP
ncbi:hypothetical protein H8N03_19365 [Ramlibacter sp. USB13]|uniref:Uncharacterized protein n=1 Tax=Ramlibacter cellulosilyticus TaxID=2764187 RepID=A0A923MTX6_9BURK|nr:hypothetical protein [Ramlibacter cellulosilyticus]MBC5785115.1 hypothetical protein [Ramlibacter cellulosilyticus]